MCWFTADVALLATFMQFGLPLWEVNEVYQMWPAQASAGLLPASWECQRPLGLPSVLPTGAGGLQS